MANYDVVIQNVEESTDLISVTGTVNKVQVAAVVKRALVPSKPADRVKRLDNALVDAFLNQPPRSPSTVAHRITR